jgi:hypothetical protein
VEAVNGGRNISFGIKFGWRRVAFDSAGCGVWNGYYKQYLRLEILNGTHPTFPMHKLRFGDKFRQRRKTS